MPKLWLILKPANDKCRADPHFFIGVICLAYRPHSIGLCFSDSHRCCLALTAWLCYLRLLEVLRSQIWHFHACSNWFRFGQLSQRLFFILAGIENALKGILTSECWFPLGQKRWLTPLDQSVWTIKVLQVPYLLNRVDCWLSGLASLRTSNSLHWQLKVIRHKLLSFIQRQPGIFSLKHRSQWFVLNLVQNSKNRGLEFKFFKFQSHAFFLRLNLRYGSFGCVSLRNGMRAYGTSC